MPGERSTHASLRRFWFDQPEAYLALFGFLFSFVWEMWQMPLYQTGALSISELTTACTVATAGDAILIVFAYSAVSLIVRSRRWLMTPRAWMIGVYLLIGLTVTVLFEELATGAAWGWTYSDRMPFLPGTHVATVPLIMWVLIPLLAIIFARRQPL